MKIFVALTALAIVSAPEIAMAKMRSANSGVEPTGKVRAEQYAKVLKWCQTKYGGNMPSQVTVTWGGIYGHKSWICYHY